jgi:uncharacterized membrane protein YgdD (TMEM256/DUF423 family)
MPSNQTQLDRLLLAVAGVLGATGIAAAAGASHGGDAPLLSAIALIALSQAPAVLALALRANRSRMFTASALAIGFGALLFSIDLGARHLLGWRLLPILAPAGGFLMIGGWLLLIVAALRPSDRGASE